MTPFDRQLALRAAAVSGLAWLVAAVVVAATDEGQGWAARLGLIAAIAPVAGGVGAWTSLGVAAMRGEERALAALGVSPARVSIGAAVGGAVPALAGALVVATPLVDLAALFPRAAASEIWVRDGGDLLGKSSGLRVAADGKLVFDGAIRAVAAFHPSREAVAIALAAAAFAVPLAVSAPRSRARAGAALGLALVALIGAFQAVAAGRVAAAWLVAAPLLLLADAARAFRTVRA